jgi:hypothetical protein
MYSAGVQQQQHFGVWRRGHATVQRSRPLTPTASMHRELQLAAQCHRPSCRCGRERVPRWCEWWTQYGAVASRGWVGARAVERGVWRRKDMAWRFAFAETTKRWRGYSARGGDTERRPCSPVLSLCRTTFSPFPHPSLVHRLEPSQLLKKPIHRGRFFAVDIKSNE